VIDLPFFDVQVSADTRGAEVARLFEQNPLLPGIIVTHQGQFLGLVARNQFFHRLGRLYGIELYSPRPITYFLDAQPQPPLIVLPETTIPNAALVCLGRPTEYVYDPFVLILKDEPSRVVDFLALVLKQTDLLTAAQSRLESELAEAATYVRSLLPSPLEGAIETHWCYLPSSHLGGDGFGYHWLDADSLAIYLLDVSGHGVGSALLATSVLNVLRTLLLADTDFHNPSAVLESLNRAFPIDGNNDKYFTIWYGVFHRPSRSLNYASGGHHAAVLVSSPDKGLHLKTEGPVIGALPDSTYPSARIEVPPAAVLYVFSDGVYEIARPDGDWQSREEFSQFLQEKNPSVETIVERMRALHGSEEFEDDFSLLRITLD